MWSQLEDLTGVLKARLIASEPESIRTQRSRAAQALQNVRKEIYARVDRPLSLFRKEQYGDAARLFLENITLSKDQIALNREMAQLCTLWDRQIHDEEDNPYKEIELVADVSREGCTRRVILVTEKEDSSGYKEVDMYEWELGDINRNFYNHIPDKFIAAGSERSRLISKEVNLGEARAFQLKDLYNEVNLLKQLQDSPFFVEYHEFLHLEYMKSSWLIIEFINIGDIDAVCQSIGSFNLKQTRAVASQVVLGVKHLHDHHIVHADIKPYNLLLSSSGLVKIVDFDLSFELISSPLVVALGRESGTRQYMAPELFPDSKENYMILYEQHKSVQLNPDNAEVLSFDFGIDVWAIGISMLDLLYGDNVFADIETYIDYDLVYRWKMRNSGRDLPGVMDDIFEKYSQNGALVYPRPDKISNILKKNTLFVEFLFQRCLVVKKTERATCEELAKSTFVSDMVHGISDSITREQIENTVAAEVLRKLIKASKLA